MSSVGKEILSKIKIEKYEEKPSSSFNSQFNLNEVWKPFKLDDDFLQKYSRIKPDWGPIGEFVFLRTYSRRIPGENRNEAWWETVRRAVEGSYNFQKEHCLRLKLPWKEKKAQRSAQIMYDKMFNFKFLPPGRGLWMSGTEFVKEKGGSGLNNCGFVSTEDIDVRLSFPFSWAMDALMLGVGVGFDTKGAGKIKIKRPKEDVYEYTIPDSREGWVESLSILLDAYFLGKKKPVFDYNQIRPYGSPIRGFGGVASGPGPLREMHSLLSNLLEKRVGEYIKSTDIVDIMNMIGVCVVAGNVRRSAEIAIGDAEDTEYTTMKDYTKYGKELQSHRWASNNSVFAKVGHTDYYKIADSIALNGEPGIVWLENVQKYSRMIDPPDWKDKLAKGVNPCSEQSLESGELCCLVETFPSRHDSYEEYQQTLKYAYLYAKSVTLVPTHWPETNAVLLKNRRIGTSQSGIIEAFVKQGRRETLRWCDEGYKYLTKLDEIYSNWLCIPKSIKITSVKPSGTVSLLPGVTPGIHYPHAEYYIRRVRLSSTSPLIEPLKKAGYHIEESAYGSDEDRKKTSVVSFPIHEKLFDRKKEDVSIWEQVKNAVDYQTWWADNSVSITVTFKKEEAQDIPHVLAAHEDKLKAISFLPLEEHGYVQAPYEEITKEKYEEMTKNLIDPDFTNLFTSPEGEKFCDSDHCVV